MHSRNPPRRLAAGAAALSLVLVAVGCGDDDDAAPDPVVDTTAPVSDTTAESGGTTANEPSVEQAEVDMVDISFDPTEITVPVGAIVVWTNQDNVDHTTTADEGTWDSGVLGSGESFEFAFDEPGTYAYLCQIHPTVMLGSITVEG